MNERIKELMEQATSKPHRSQGIGGEPTHIYPGTLDPEKFAELIVRECIGIVKQRWINPDEDVIAEEIKQHFGVEL
jgi:hypothetical protein